MHVLFKIVLELLALRREDLLALGGLHGDLGGQLESVRLLFDLTTHVLLDHKGVHVDVGLESATVGRVRQAVVFEGLPDLESLLLLSQDFVETLYLTSLQLELLLDGVDARLVLLQEHVKLGHVHFADSAVVVGHVRVDGALGARLRVAHSRRDTPLHLVSLAQLLQ